MGFRSHSETGLGYFQEKKLHAWYLLPQVP
jgi:hypothetical protein